MVILKIFLWKKAVEQVHKLVPFKRPPLKKLELFELQVIIIASVFGFFFQVFFYPITVKMRIFHAIQKLLFKMNKSW
jgi:hypothetical protein